MKCEFDFRRVSCLISLSLIILILVCPVQCDNGVDYLSYYPSSYSVLKGTSSSGSIPTSVQTIDADYLVTQSEATEAITSAYPLGYMLKGSTNLISGDFSSLASNDSAYMTFCSYTNDDVRYNESLGQSSTTSTMYQNKLTLTFTPPTAGDYIIIADAEVQSTSSAYYYPQVRLYINPNVYQEIHRGVRDSGDWYPFNALKRLDLSAETTIRLQWCTSGMYTASIRNARLIALKVPSEYAENETRATTTSTSWQTHATLTFTPSTAGDYLIIATANLDESSASYFFRCRLLQDDLTEHAITTKLPAAGVPYNFGVMRRVTLNATSHNFKIQWCSSNSSATAGISYAHVVAIRVDQFPNSYYQESEAESSPPLANTWYDKVTSTYTPQAGDHLIIGSIHHTSASASYSVGIRLNQSGTIATDRLMEYSDTSDYEASFSFTKASLTATNNTDAMQYMGESTLTKVKMARIISLQLFEQISEVEFTGSSNKAAWLQLAWTIDSAWTTGSVTATIQLYNYTLGGYATLGNGYYSYTSSSTANTDEAITQTIIENPTHFRNESGNWKIKVKGVKTTTTTFDFEADWIEFKFTYNAEYTVSTEFPFSGITNSTPTKLNFTVVGEYNLTGVNVTIQIWNYSSSVYVTSGDGYSTYSSTGTSLTMNININIDPGFYVSNGNAKIKISGVQTESGFQQKINQIILLYGYAASDNLNGQPFDWTWGFLCTLLVVIGLFLLLIFLFRRNRTKTGTTGEKKVDPFSKSFGINHNWMNGKKVLLEIDPTANYQNALFDFAYEAKNNGEKLFIFTSVNSPLHSEFAGTRSAKFFLLASEAYSSKEINSAETLLSVTDLSVLLNEFVSVQKFKTRKTKTVLFDNVSDLILLCGFEKTYKFMRWLLETPSSPRAITLFVFNPAAHDPRNSSSIRGLFQSRLAYTKSGPKIGTL